VGQPPKFVCSDWARQAAEIALDKKEPVITVGSLDAQIDFSDVRDVVAAYSAILEKGRPGEAYNVCSGRAVSLEHILSHLIARTGRRVDVQSVQKKVRSHSTSPRLVGDNRKLIDHTGWRPLIPLEQTLDELFDHWKAEVSKGS
jgi:GDP-4-dehydro-6-deoxy-D-mannose reductase